MKKFSFFVLLLLCSSPLFSITITWTGNGGDNLWNNTANWDSGTVPGSQDDIIIPDNSGQVQFNYSFRRAKSLQIGLNAQVEIMAKNRLYLSYYNTAIRILNYGELLVQPEATIVANNSDDIGIANKGLIDNYGLISLHNHDTDAILNYGTLRNRYGGTLQIYDANGWGINSADGALNNGGEIRFRANYASDGLIVGASFQNDPAANITFEANNPGFIQIVGTANQNWGTISFQSGNTPGHCILLSTNAVLLNATGAKIFIEGYADAGISLPDNGLIGNNGLIDVIGNGDGVALALAGNSTFLNSATGTVSLFENNTGLILFSSDTDFRNDGNFNAGENNYGVINNGLFRNDNGATVKIVDCYTGILNGSSGRFWNDDSSIGMYGHTASSITNQGEFLNKVCGIVSGEQRILNTGDFENDGWLFYDTPGVNHYSTGNQVINRGVVVDSYNRWGNALDNQKAHIIALQNPQANVPYSNTFDIASTTNLVIQGFYLNSSLTQSAGTYNLITNVYTPNNAAIGATFLYIRTAVNGGSCDYRIRVRVDGGVQPITSDPVHEWAAQREAPRDEWKQSDFKVYPNPSTGRVELEWSEAWEGQLDLRLLDTNGREVWRGTSNAESLQMIDWSGKLSNGIYQLQVWQSGQLLGQERLLIQTN